MKRSRLFILFIMAVFSLAILLPPAINVSYSQLAANKEEEVIKKESQTFWQILTLFANAALEKPPDIRLCAYEMFRLKPNKNSCRDKYSAWHSEEENRQMLTPEFEGRIGGIGIEISEQNGKIVVMSLFDDTPAFKAGIKSGDTIIEINDKQVNDITEAVSSLRGQRGTIVKIKVDRNGKKITFNITRETIFIHAISSKIINVLSNKIGYIKIKHFSQVLPEEFRKAMSAFRDQNIKKVILDYRDNPGGLLWEALDILYDFAKPNDILITVRERNSSTTHDAALVKQRAGLIRKPGEFRDTRIVILINKESASASEIFAGTMKDWGFPIVGSRSLGKGVGQTIFPLANGSVLRLTTFEFLVGNSRTKINNVGVIPNYEISDPLPSVAEILREDFQLKKAIEILSH